MQYIKQIRTSTILLVALGMCGIWDEWILTGVGFYHWWVMLWVGFVVGGHWPVGFVGGFCVTIQESLSHENATCHPKTTTLPCTCNCTRRGVGHRVRVLAVNKRRKTCDPVFDTV